MALLSHDSALGATLAGLVDRLTPRGPTVPLDDLPDLGATTALVTGASRGLGKAIATDLARRGATVWIACRSRGEQTRDELRAAAGHDRVHLVELDLASPASVRGAVEVLAASSVVLDAVVLNAGTVPLASRQTDAGLDVMVHVNFLANVDLIDRLLAAGVLRPALPAPRVVVVGSEAHRSAGPFDVARVRATPSYGTSGVLAQYAVSKQLLHTWVSELARRLAADPSRPHVAVHHLCPGAVDTDIAREAPAWSQPLLRVVFKLAFQSPAEAARPAVWLAASRAVAGEPCVYLHLGRRAAPAPETTDPRNGLTLWREAHDLIATLGAPA